MASAIGALIISLTLAQMQLERLIATPVHVAPIARIIQDPAMTDLVMSTAAKYHLNTEHFVTVINCESGASSTIQSNVPNPKGPSGRENSWGIAQINLDPENHPEVTKAQALDPAWSLDWMAQKWVAGHAAEWTCWKDHYQLIPTPVSIAVL